MTKHNFSTATPDLLFVVQYAMTLVKTKYPQDWDKLNQSGLALQDFLEEVETAIALTKDGNNE